MAGPLAADQFYLFRVPNLNQFCIGLKMFQNIGMELYKNRMSKCLNFDINSNIGLKCLNLYY